MLAEDLRPLKRARKSPCNQVGQKKKESEKEIGMGPAPLQGAVKEARFLHPGKSPHQ